METKITGEFLTHISNNQSAVVDGVVEYILEQCYEWASLGAKTYYFKVANDLCGGYLYNEKAYKQVLKVLKDENGIDARLTSNGIIVAWE